MIEIPAFRDHSFSTKISSFRDRFRQVDIRHQY